MNPWPTSEQHEVLQVRGRVVKINSRAGTGKTVTLRMVAEAPPESDGPGLPPG
ncbi:MAG: hypothetical protein R6U88_06490 [Candidatus Bipolaricaulota bacterium]